MDKETTSKLHLGIFGFANIEGGIGQMDEGILRICYFFIKDCLCRWVANENETNALHYEVDNGKTGEYTWHTISTIFAIFLALKLNANSKSWSLK